MGERHRKSGAVLLGVLGPSQPLETLCLAEVQPLEGVRAQSAEGHGCQESQAQDPSWGSLERKEKGHSFSGICSQVWAWGPSSEPCPPVLRRWSCGVVECSSLVSEDASTHYQHSSR